MLTLKSIENLQNHPAFVRAAELMLTALAHKQLIEEIVVPYQLDVLREGQWPIKTEYCKGGEFGDRGFDSGTIVLTPERAYLMSDEDHARYLAKLTERRITAGLSIRAEGNCPLLEAKSDLIEAEHLLMIAAKPFTGIDPSNLYLAKRRDYINLLSRLAAPKVRSANAILEEIAA